MLVGWEVLMEVLREVLMWAVWEVLMEVVREVLMWVVWEVLMEVEAQAEAGEVVLEGFHSTVAEAKPACMREPASRSLRLAPCR